MIYWTILVIVYGAGPLEGNVTMIPFISEEACGEFLADNYQPQFLDSSIVVQRVQCKASDTPSGSITPKKKELP